MIEIKIDKKSKIPIYIQFLEQIKLKILSGDIKEKENLPTEFEFCEHYELSRTTVRLAMTELVRCGLICRIRGRGTFVTSQKIVQNRASFSKFYDDVKKQGKTPKSKVMKIIIEEASNYLAQKMQLKSDRIVCKIKWVRYADNSPVIFETINFPYKKVKGIENFDLEKIKLYDLLENHFNLKMDYVKEKFIPCVVNEIESKHLDLLIGEIGMKIERLSFREGEIIEYTESTVRGDSFIFTTEYKINNGDKDE